MAIANGMEPAAASAGRTETINAYKCMRKCVQPCATQAQSQICTSEAEGGGGHLEVAHKVGGVLSDVAEVDELAAHAQQHEAVERLLHSTAALTPPHSLMQHTQHGHSAPLAHGTADGWHAHNPAQREVARWALFSQSCTCAGGYGGCAGDI